MQNTSIGGYKKLKEKKPHSFDVPDASEACKVITARKQGDET